MKAAVCVLLLVLSLPSAGWAAACVTSGRPPQTFYVSTTGSDANTGTLAEPLRTVQAGVDCLGVPGDRLLVLGGIYTERVKLQGKNGLPGKPIVIEGQPGTKPGPVARIQASITTLAGSSHTFSFHTGSAETPNGEWLPAAGPDAHPQEYVSREIFPKPPNISIADWLVNRGTFVDSVNGRYTQLIPYRRLEDLRAENETDEAICESPTDARFPADPRPGPVVVGASACPSDCTDCRQRRPWVYMGPGLWFDQTGETALRVHIRLSPTHNNVPGLPDYSGEADPNKVALTIVEQNMNALTVVSSSNLLFKRLAFHHGGETLSLGGHPEEGARNIGFDDVIVAAGRYGARTGNVKSLRFTNCVFDGGLPTWMFRSDLKNEYAFVDNGQTVKNTLGKQTMETLFANENGTNSGVTFDHCEFVNAHDLYLTGSNVSFHHNLVRNLHDEALLLDGAPTANGSIHHNVIEQTLSAISSAEKTNIAGPWNIYRNLIDLRQPTAGIRPQNAGFDRSQVWRVGRAFKSNGTDGTYHVFQNTFILPYRVDLSGAQPTVVDYLRAPIADQHKHTSINNIFAVVNREAQRDPAIAILPAQDLTGDSVASNGNLYYRIGGGSNLFALPIPGNPKGITLFACVPATCDGSWHAHPFFIATRAARPPGDEANGVLLQDPAFLHWSKDPNAAGETDVADDFRLQASSPGRGTGSALPPDLKALDLDTAGIAAPDVGAYQASPTTGLAPKLAVGVRGRRVYPQVGPGS